jgi:hypothetical protein
MDWYYAVGGEQKGPVAEAEIESMVRGGVVSPDTLVWVEGMPEWRRVSDVKPEWAPPPPVAVSSQAAVPPVVPAGSALCAKCGRVVPAEDTVRIGAATVCAACKAGALQAVLEGVPASGRGEELERVLGVARAQKGVIWCILAGLLNMVFMFAMGATVRFGAAGGASAPLMFVPMIVALVILVFQVIYAYRLGAALDRQLAWLWVLGLLVGFFLCSFLGLILLLVLSGRATSVIRRAGFRVGLMGANLGEIRQAMGTR